MEITVNGELRHLTYCTNIHPSKGWEQLFANLQQYVPAVREKVAPDSRFGIGLCFSNQQTLELLEKNRMKHFKRWLDENDFYVFTLNGFVYNEFHTPHIKDTIYKPDWRTKERTDFTQRLIYILSLLLPDDLQEGSFSTSPLSYKHWDDMDTSSDEFWKQLTRQVIRMVDAMLFVRKESGKRIHMDIEPEPDCLLETSAEVIGFFQNWLLRYGAEELAKMQRCSIEAAQTYILEHVQVCFDVCHAAVEYENIAEMLDDYAKAGIRIGKIQVSSALRVDLSPDPVQRAAKAAWLNEFAEDNFLHQVVQRNHDGTFTRYPDLPTALPQITTPQAAEWRIHYHVPVFLESTEKGSTTQNAILDAFRELRKRDYTRFIEVETYTWKVLPPELRLDLTESISRELNWMIECL
jgi:hypothetical protein